MMLGRLKEAAEHLERLIDSEPAYPLAHYNLAWTLYLDGSTEYAIREMRDAVDLAEGDATYRCNLACLLGLTGGSDEAKGLVAEVEELSRTTYVGSGNIAIALFGIGRVDEAFAYLEASYRDGSDSVYHFGAAPWFAKWRRDPRWEAIEEGLGLA